MTTEVKVDWDDLPAYPATNAMDRWGERKIWVQARNGRKYTRSAGVTLAVTRATHERLKERLSFLKDLRIGCSLKWKEHFEKSPSQVQNLGGQMREFVNKAIEWRGFSRANPDLFDKPAERAEIVIKRSYFQCFDAPMNSFNQSCIKAFRDGHESRYPWLWLPLTQHGLFPRATPTRLRCGVDAQLLQPKPVNGNVSEWWQLEDDMFAWPAYGPSNPLSAETIDLMRRCSYAEIALEKNHWSARFIRCENIDEVK